MEYLASNSCLLQSTPCCYIACGAVDLQTNCETLVSDTKHKVCTHIYSLSIIALDYRGNQKILLFLHNNINLWVLAEIASPRQFQPVPINKY